MNFNPTQKERSLLEDQKKHEEICVQKYNDYANKAQDPQLKQLFQNNAKSEQRHLDTINQMLGGQVPNMQPQGQQAQQTNQFQQNQTAQAKAGFMQNKTDAALCQDMLMTEKYVSNAYDTSIFEFADTNARQALNHIQKEEQQHGEGIYNYLNSKGMYNITQ